MKINPVKQFVRDNVLRFERDKDSSYYLRRLFNLYDKNNSYRGEYDFMVLHSNGYRGIKTFMSTTRIMNDKLKQEMQEIVYADKDFVDLYDPNSEDLLKMKSLLTEITTTTTVLDFLNDKFKTVRTVSKLKNKLQRMSKDNPDFIWSDNHVIYEPLNEKPQYEKSIEYIREGSISETQKHNPSIHSYYRNSRLGSLHQIPYRFW